METVYLNHSFGLIEIKSTEQSLASVSFLSKDSVSSPPFKTSNPLLNDAIKQLNSYFAGKLQQFDLPLEVKGTDFQKKVWSKLLSIPYSETISYGELAREIGSKNYSRAVGMACGKNQHLILIPCHRIIGSKGEITGFAAGVKLKQYLIDLER